MISLGLVLLIIGAVVAVACHFGTVPVGVRIGLITAVVGLVLVVLAYLIPALTTSVEYHDARAVTGFAQPV